MQRLVGLIIVTAAACGPNGTDTGTGMITGVTPPGMSATVRTFEGPTAEGTKVMGWKLEFFDKGPGADCLSSDVKVVASVGIFTNQPADGSKPQAILQTGGISIVTQSPPSLQASATAATMGAIGVSNIMGLINIDEFHLTPDAMHADRIKGTVSAGGNDDGSGSGVLLDGTFDAPLCEKN